MTGRKEWHQEQHQQHTGPEMQYISPTVIDNYKPTTAQSGSS